MLNLVRIVGIGLSFLLLPSLVLSGPSVFPWKAEFSENSSSSLAEVHETLYASNVAGLAARSVSGLVWREEDLELKIQSGTIFLEPPIEGITVGAFFEGDATISYRPRSAAGRTMLQMYLDREEIVDYPIGTAYLFSLRTDSPLASLRDSDPGGAPSSPVSVDTYLSDKSAMRQLGLDLTWLFLNRAGPAEGASYVLFPMNEIRTKRSEEARILYTFNPMDEVELSVFGHEEMVAMKPYKFRFYTLVSYPPHQGSTGMIDVERTLVKLSQGHGAETAAQETEIQYQSARGLKSLRFDLTPQMAITKVTGPEIRIVLAVAASQEQSGFRSDIPGITGRVSHPLRDHHFLDHHLVQRGSLRAMVQFLRSH
ncbi:MAG: hypothetical protein O7A63_07675 [Acidobacteria bacterium]|nr:hypothetical protein [Acidobacteriota bacterium]